tara:strand:+ start:1137 stop:1325 length:189 start_codon:yes stop_codon:yes gene_type:complete
MNTKLEELKKNFHDAIANCEVADDALDAAYRMVRAVEEAHDEVDMAFIIAQKELFTYEESML